MANDDVRDIISILFDALGMRKYIGMRYVPIFGRHGETTMDWDNTKPYEQLTVVLHNGNSYTSKQFVPIGVDITNTDFWALSGNYNAQVEEYKQAADSAAEEAHTATENVDRLESLLPDTEFSSKNTVKNYIDDLYDNVSEDYFYNNITIETGREDDTDYYIAYVPLHDDNDNIIEPQIIKHSNENPLQNAVNTGATLNINGSATIKLSDTTFVQGTTINNGVILNEHSYADDSTVSPLNYPLYLCFNENREITEIVLNTNPSAASLIESGYKTVFPCYAKLASNGSFTPLDNWNPRLQINGTTFTNSTRNPMMLMGITTSLDLYFLACDGKTLLNKGLYYQTGVELLLEKGCNDVYMMDGGGSTCLVYRGSKLNRNIDNDGTAIRDIHYSLSFIKASENNCQKHAFGMTGMMREFTNEQLLSYINQNAFARRAPNTIESNTNLNDITTIGKYQCVNSSIASTVVNNPFNSPFDLYVLQYGYYNNMVMQVAVTTSYSNPNYKNQMAFRFVDLIDSTSIQPYTSDWTYILDSAPLKVTLGQNESYTFKYKYSRPVINLVYRYGNSSTGNLIIEYNNYYIVSSTGLTVSDYLTITYDNSNRTITITNTSGGRFNGIITNGYWND